MIVFAGTALLHDQSICSSYIAWLSTPAPLADTANRKYPSLPDDAAIRNHGLWSQLDVTGEVPGCPGLLGALCGGVRVPPPAITWSAAGLPGQLGQQARVCGKDEALN
jgi:hypothetical protein